MKQARRDRGTGPFPLTVNPGHYNGFYLIDPPRNGGQLNWLSGINTLLLYEGFHYFDIGQSSFSFEVDPNGRIVNVSDGDAATASGDGFSLEVKTTHIIFDPDDYGEANLPGYYFLKTYARHNAAGYPGTGVRGKQTVALIPGLEYYVDNGSYTGNSIFGFEVKRNGSRFVVSHIRPVGVATPVHSKTLRFATAPMRIGKANYDLDYMLSTYRYLQLRGDRTVNLIRGLTMAFFNGAALADPSGTSYFYATVGLDGNWSDLRSADGTVYLGATISGDLLTFNTVNVTIQPEPGYLQGWRLSSDVNHVYNTDLPVTIPLIPGLLYWVRPEGLPEKYFLLRYGDTEPAVLEWSSVNFSLSVVP